MTGMPEASAYSSHLVLEINGKCNISCTGCYKRLDGSTRTLDAVLGELRFALSKRRIHTVSIAGGEPTLHPQLPQIVQHIHNSRLKVILLTNGVRLDDNLLSNLKKAGLGLLMLHIDEGQNRPDLPRRATFEQVSTLRSAVARRVAAHNIDVGLIVTAYREHADRLPSLIEYVLNSNHIGVLFVTHYVGVNDFAKSIRSFQSGRLRAPAGADADTCQAGRTTNEQIYAMLRARFGLEPFKYLPFDTGHTRQEGDFAWMMYLVPVVRTGDRTEFFHIKPNYLHALRLLFSAPLAARHAFHSRDGSIGPALMTLCNMLVNGQLQEAVRFFRQLRCKGSMLETKKLLFENGPRLTNSGRFSCCASCQNPTVRGERFVSVCLADYPCLTRE